MTHAGPEGTTSGNSSRHDKKVGLGLTSSKCHLSHVCLSGHIVGGLNTILLYTREARKGIVQLIDT
jgi:hypothetical protein